MSQYYGDTDFQASGLSKVSQVAVKSSTGAFQLEVTWAGLETAIDVAAANLSAQGVAVRTVKAAGIKQLTALYAYDPTNPSVEVAFDSYGLRMELIYQSLWSHPKLWPELNGGSEFFSNRKKDILDAANNGTVLNSTLASIAGAREVYSALVRGLSVYPLKSPILRRRRTYSWGYSTRRTIEILPKAYTRDALVSVFNIPSYVQDILPSDPAGIAPPDGTTWAWWMREDDVDSDAGESRWVEQADWVFGAWDNFFFDIVSL